LAPNFLAPLPTRWARWSAFSSSTAYLRPLQRTSGHAVFHMPTTCPGREAETRLLDFRKIGALAPECLLGLLLPTCARLTTRRTYSLNTAHFWTAGLPTTLGRTFVVLRNFDIRCQNRAPLRVPLSPKGPIELPCRSRSFLPIIGHNKAQRAPSLPGHRTCGRDLPRTNCRAQPNKRHKPVVVLIHPTDPHKRPAAPGTGCTINPRLCFRTTLYG
jgi:hypothetical protein